MNSPKATIRVDVDTTNPGHFFASCGLLELADRLWSGAEGWFDQNQFCIATKGGLRDLIQAIVESRLDQLDTDDSTASPIGMQIGSRALRLDWWHDEFAGGKELKVWAGTMESVRIARAMKHSMRDARFGSADLFDVGMVAYDPDDAKKKVEPFYFDARRTPNAHSRDVGFSPNDLKMTTTAFPAVEFCCLVGLQRCLPARTGKQRVFDYYTWRIPLPPSLCQVAACGLLTHGRGSGYRFENWYRTGQRKHKAFRSAVPISQRGEE